MDLKYLGVRQHDSHNLKRLSKKYLDDTLWQNVNEGWTQVVGLQVFICYYSLYFSACLKFFIIKGSLKLNGFTILSTGTSGQNSQNFEHQESSILKGKIICEYGLNDLKCLWILWCCNLRIIYYLFSKSAFTLSFSFPSGPIRPLRGNLREGPAAPSQRWKLGRREAPFFLELDLHQVNQKYGETLLLKINFFLNKLPTIWKTEHTWLP